MRNIDWLCENDREQLMKLLAEGDSCEYCALEIEDDCGIRCNEGVRAWLDAEHVSGPNETANGTDAGLEPDSDLLEPDTREKLESDMNERLGELWADAWDAGSRDSMDDDFDIDVFNSLLDRQKAIAERECAERIRPLEQNFQAVKDDRDDCCRRIVKLTVERDSLETRLSNCQDRIRQLEAERDKQSEHIRQLKQVVQADKEDCAQSFADMKVMENERDRARIERGWLVREVNGLMKNQPYTYDPETPIASLKTLGRYIGEQSEELDAALRMLDDEKRLTSTYRRERDEFRKKLGDAVWHAQAIARITEVD